MRLGSLFSGYGGLDRAIATVYGADTAWLCENDPAASRVLAHRYPDVPNLGDITMVRWEDVESVDILAGGFPCQDVSVAGLKAGIRPGTRSGLWVHMAEAVKFLRPRIVVIENVRGILSASAHSHMEPCPRCVGDGGKPALRALGAVLGDLADIGYDAWWTSVRASDVGAPHRRSRIFVVATPHTVPGGRIGRPGRSPWGRDEPPDAGDAPADPYGTGPQGEPARRPDPPARGPVPRERRTWGPYAPAVVRWGHVVGRRAPAAHVAAPRGGHRLSPYFVEWMMGIPDGWVTSVPGNSYRDQLRILGNGVVPQQAIKALNDLRNTITESE